MHTIKMTIFSWVISYGYLLNVSYGQSRDTEKQQTVASLQLQEIPHCTSQPLPTEVREWQPAQAPTITVEWSYGGNVSSLVC